MFISLDQLKTALNGTFVRQDQCCIISVHGNFDPPSKEMGCLFLGSKGSPCLSKKGNNTLGKAQRINIKKHNEKHQEGLGRLNPRNRCQIPWVCRPHLASCHWPCCGLPYPSQKAQVSFWAQHRGPQLHSHWDYLENKIEEPVQQDPHNKGQSKMMYRNFRTISRGLYVVFGPGKGSCGLYKGRLICRRLKNKTGKDRFVKKIKV